VLAHGRALLSSRPEGKCAYIQADLRDPERILSRPDTRQTLDFDKPIALVLLAVLHFLPDPDELGRIVETLVAALPSGSYTVASHGTSEYSPENGAEVARAYQRGACPCSRGRQMSSRTSRSSPNMAVEGGEDERGRGAGRAVAQDESGARIRHHPARPGGRTRQGYPHGRRLGNELDRGASE
jgi:hypothetical protein